MRNVVPIADLTRVAGFVAALCLLVVSSGCGGGDAPIQVSPAEYDFGRVMQGESRKHTFTLTNKGNRTVAFTVQPNCGCFAVSRSLRPLDPGETQEFEVRFTSANLEGPIRGKWIQIRTDHPDQPKIVLPLKGEIYRAFDLRPALFQLGQIDGSDANYEPRKVYLRTEGEFRLRFLGYFATPQVVEAEAEPLDGGGLVVTLRLRKDVARPKGPFLCQVRLDIEVTAPSGEVKRHQPVVHLRGVWTL